MDGLNGFVSGNFLLILLSILAIIFSNDLFFILKFNKKLEILDNIGIKFDRNFAFTRDLDDAKINYILNNPLQRQIVNFLSLYSFKVL